MKATVMTKSEIKEALVRSDCPEILIERIGEDLLLWWKTGWLQEILLAQKKAGIKEVVEWIASVSEYYQCGACDYDRHIRDKLWQSKLKEWGLE